jgi:Fe-S oxidoreductase
VKSSLPPVLLMEPASQEKRRVLSDALRDARRTVRPSREEVVERLKEIRAYSAAHVDELARALIALMKSYPRVACTFARDAGEAVETISRVAGDRAIAVSRAAVIGNELSAGLIRSGCHVIDSYDGRFTASPDTAAGRQAALAAMTLESRFESFGKPRDLAGGRAEAVGRGSTRDFVGLLGINAISAQDGSVVMLEHTSNISRVFESAADLVIVAGLDKIVRNLEDALFQTKCTALFGARALPLSMGISSEEKADFESLLSGMPSGKAASRLHLVLLDNDRTSLLRSAFADFFLCIGCRACTAVCPAYRSGKPLVPRDVVANLKKYLPTVGPGLLHGEAEPFRERPAGGPMGGEIEEDAIWACTACHACTVACPLGLRHTDAITGLRRNLAMIATSSRSSRAIRNPVKNIELKGHPWTGINLQREGWKEGLNVATMADQAGPIDILYWVGCTLALDDRGGRVARATASLMARGGLGFAILGNEESCCGEPLRQMGSEYLFEAQAERNVRKLNGYGIRRIVTSCPHCYNMLKKEYPRFGGEFEVIHHTELFARLLQEGKLRAGGERGRGDGVFTYHDPCCLGRQNDIYNPPRQLLQAATGRVREMDQNREGGFCCGGGGGRMWLEENIGQRINEIRIEEALRTGATVIATACPFCLQMFEDGVKAKGTSLGVMDVAELVIRAVSGQEE